MTCEQVERLLARAADAALDPQRREAVDRHVAGCAACREALDAQRTTRSALAARPDAAVRPGFVTRVMANLPAQDPAGGSDEAVAPNGDWIDLLNWRAWTIRLAPVAATLLLAAAFSGGAGAGTNGAGETTEAIAFTDLAAAWAIEDGTTETVTRLWQDETATEGDDLLLDVLLAGQ